MGKKIGISCSLAALGLAVLLSLAMRATSGVVDVADKFLEHIAQEHTDQAYSLLGPEVTKEIPREKFEDFLKASLLKKTHSGSWSNRSVENGVGEVSGTFTLSTGGSKRVHFVLHKIDGDWRIQGIQFPNKEISEGDIESQKNLGSSFFEILSKGDYPKAYELCGSLLKKGLDLAAFQEMLQERRLDSYKNLAWKESKPNPLGTTLKGVLTRKDDSRLSISLAMQEIDEQWRIQGYSLDPIISDGQLPMPQHKEALELSSQVLKSIAVYADKKDIKPLTALCYSSFAKTMETENAMDRFLQTFSDLELFRALLDSKIVLTAEPEIDDQNILSLEGRSELTEQNLYITFEFRFAVENGKWSLLTVEFFERGPEDGAPKPALQI